MAYMMKSNMIFLTPKIKKKSKKYNSKPKDKFHPIRKLFKDSEKSMYIEYFVNEYKHRVELKKEYEKNTIDMDKYFTKRW